MTISSEVRSFTLGQSLVVCLALYLSVTAPGLLTEGFNADDWRQVSGAPLIWVTIEGRWFTHFIYHHIFGDHFVPPLQVALAFLCFAWVSHLLATYSVQAPYRPAASALIFLLGVHHAYLCDALNFNSSVFAYPLALGLSLTAFHVVFKTWGRFGYLADAAIVLLAIQMIALACGLYQSFALFGLIIPGLVLARVDRYPLPTALWFGAGSVAVLLAGFGLCMLELRLYAMLHDADLGTVSSYGPATVQSISDKVVHLPVALIEIYAGKLLRLPKAVGALTALYALAALSLAAATSLAVLTRRGENGSLVLVITKAARVGLAAAGLLFLPIAFWFAYSEPFIPARATGYLGFLMATLVIANASLFDGAIDQPHIQLWLRRLVVGATLAVGSIHLITCAAIWQDRARIATRDMELARAMFARVSTLEGYDGGPIRIVGSAIYSDHDWGGSLGGSIFHSDHGPHSIFHEILNVPWMADSFSISPKACNAFPSAGSAFIEQGAAYVCLDANPSLLPLTNCASFARRDAGKLCFSNDRVVQVADKCDSQNLNLIMELQLRRQGRPKDELVRIHPMDVHWLRAFGHCFRAIPIEGGLPEAVTVSVRRMSSGTLWRERIDGRLFNQSLP